jgi:hypothetical protein
VSVQSRRRCRKKAGEWRLRFVFQDGDGLHLFCYFSGWWPGFPFNLIKLLRAAFEKDSSDSVYGFGCLVWLLIICGFNGIEHTASTQG